MKNNSMNAAINTILENIGNNPEAMKALLEAISETGKIASETKTEQTKKSCRYVICIERMCVRGEKVYHPIVLTPPTCSKPRMLIANNAVEAQDMAQTYGMRIQDNVYAMPATEAQIAKLIELLKECNKRIVNAVNTAVRTVGNVSSNIDTDALCAQYMQQMMKNCNGIIGSSLNKDSQIIEEDIEVIRPDRIVDECDDYQEDDDEYDDECDCCDCNCCPHNPNY